MPRGRFLLSLLLLALLPACHAEREPADPGTPADAAVPADVVALAEQVADVVLPTEDELRARAQASIDASNADAEYARLATEIENDG